MVREVVFATRNAGKTREVAALLEDFGIPILSPGDVGVAEDPAEDALEVFDTFEENAEAKARWFFERCGGRAVLADDSGLEVDALGGRPGVRSKRWSGREDLHGAALDLANNAYLWRALDESGAAPPYSARFVCAAACVWQGGTSVSRGVVDGYLVREARGGEGFGYDPHFVVPALGDVTFGQASLASKSRVSHRARAFRALAAQLRTFPSFPGMPVDPTRPRV